MRPFDSSLTISTKRCNAGQTSQTTSGRAMTPSMSESPRPTRRSAGRSAVRDGASGHASPSAAAAGPADPTAEFLSLMYAASSTVEEAAVPGVMEGLRLRLAAGEELLVALGSALEELFGATPEAASLAACRARANDLMALSRERIAMELLAILALPDPSAVLELMIANGIFAPVLPEITEHRALSQLVAFEVKASISPEPIRRLSSLLAADPALAEDIANRLKLSNAQRKRMVLVAGRTQEDADHPRALAYQLGLEVAQDRLLLGKGDLAALSGWTPPRFPLSGGAIVARGVQAGPDVARILQAVERQWVEEGFPDQGRAEAIADQLTQIG